MHRRLAPPDDPDVRNQAPPRVGLNEYTTNAALRGAVGAFGAAWADATLVETGAHVGTAEFQDDAERANVHEPLLLTHDRWGHRIDEVIYDPAYHRVVRAAVERGAHTTEGWASSAGASVARAVTFMLLAQIEPGHACPLSMTHAAVAALAGTPLAEAWVPRLGARSYEPRLSPTGEKPSALIGMAMTEKQGGSDVRANLTIGRHRVDDEYVLDGHKWFCSAPMSDGFLVLAQTLRGATEQGLSCLFVPRVLPDGTRNPFRIQRLKEKLGNRSNASSEVELDGTVGTLIGEPGRGVRAIIPMVQRTRLDCVLGTAAGMRQAVAEALWHVSHRAAFGRTLIHQPAMTSVVADLALESHAAMLTGLRLAQAFADDATSHDIALRRLATPVAKYWVCKRGPHHAYESMECLGGNGYTEAFPLARRYRDQPVMAIWEGSGNVIALDVVRALQRDAESVESVADELSSVRGNSTLLDGHVDETLARLRRLATADADEAAASARGVTERLALALQGALMLRHASTESAGAFLSARLGAERGWHYGMLSSRAARAVLADAADVG